MEKIGLQLYTLRNQLTTPAQTDACLRTVKAVGYDEVQVYGDLETMERLGKAALQAGLTVVGSTMMPFALMAQEPEKTMALHAQLGTRHIGIGFYRCETQADVAEFIRKVNELAEIFASNGFMLSYHNHSHEFVKIDGVQTVFDYLVEGFDPRITFVPDTYWLQHGGADIRHTLERLAGRIDILHLKDMKRLASPEAVTYAEIGRGNLYWDGILETAEKCGVRHYVVEQDECGFDPLESIRISSEYLHRNFMKP